MMEKPTIFKTHWDKETVTVTVITTIAILIIMPLCLWFAPAALKLIIGALIVVPLAWIACLTPRSLTMTDAGVELRRVVGRLKIPADEIIRMREVSPEEFKGAIRIAGSGGFCGYIGKFRNKRLGNFTLNITDQRNLIMVETKKKKYIFNGMLDR